MVIITQEELEIIRNMARHGINQTVQHMTVEQLSEVSEAILKLDTVIAGVKDESLKTVEIEQTLTNITHKDTEHG